MRNFYRGMLLGILLSSGIPLVSMEQALEAMENGNNPNSNQPLNPNNQNPRGDVPTPPPSEPTPPPSEPTPPPSEPTPPPSEPTPPPSAPTPPPGVPTPPPSAPTPPPSAPTPPPSVPTPPPSEPTPPPSEPTPPPAVPTPPPAVPTPSNGMPTPSNGMPTLPPGVPHHASHPVSHSVSPVESMSVEPKATVQVVDVESSGLDTINIDSGGNWLEKRIWFKKAEALFDDIRKTVEQAADIRMEFVDAVNAVGKKVDNFYDVVSYDKGQLEELLKSASRNVSEASVKREGDLSVKERSLHVTIQTEQKQIEQIGDDIKKVEEFDVQIDKTMSQAFKTIDACRALEGKAWDDFKAIGSELDDKKARILYYEMDNAQKNIEQHIRYLKGTLLPYLQNKLVSSADNVMTTVLNSVKALEAKGVNLKSLLNVDEQKDLAIEQEREVAKEKEAEATWEKEEKAKELKQEEQKEQEDVAKKSSKKKQDDQEIAWYMKFLTSMSNRLQNLGCFLLNAIRAISCKVFEIAPGFFESVSQIAKSLWEQIVAFCSMLPCYFKCMVCSIRSWLCELFGK